MRIKNVDRLKFFQKENEEAEIKIIKVLNRVISETLRCYDDVVSIMLFGSLASGEGVWKREGKKIKVLSDLDLFIITKKRRVLAKKLKKLKHAIGEIKKKEDIEVDLKFACYSTLKKMKKDTHTFDRKEGITIWGKDVTSYFPEFKDGDINIKDIIFSFFNQVLLNIESFPMFDTENLNTKKWLTYMASKNILTCTRMISIYHNNYSPSILKRVEFTKKKCEELTILNKDIFLEDLNTSVDFRFKDVNNYYLIDAYNYWVRSREYLIKLFQFLCIGKNLMYCINEKMFESQLSFLYKVEYKVNLKILLYYLYKLIVLKKIPKFPKTKEQYPIYCRMASLMLFFAINKGGPIEDYLIKAENYLSMVYHVPKIKGMCSKDKWIFLRDELEKLHIGGIF